MMLIGERLGNLRNSVQNEEIEETVVAYDRSMGPVYLPTFGQIYGKSRSYIWSVYMAFMYVGEYTSPGDPMGY